MSILEATAYRHEVEWWQRHAAEDGGDAHEQWVDLADPNRPVLEYLAPYMKDANDTVLDVGAGPMTQVGHVFKGSPVDVTAVDPLADFYDDLPFRRPRPVATRFGFGETLSKSFAENSFDIAHARNSLDHSMDPLKCIYEMINVTKPGGYIVLHHCMAEGARTSYVGLHQWDLLAKGGSFFVANHDRDIVINVTKQLDYVAEQVAIATPAVYSPILKTHVTWVHVVFKKRPDALTAPTA